MRIYGPHGTAAATPAPAARRARSGEFVVPQEEAASTASPIGGPRTVGGIDALIALQGVAEDPAERRRRAVGRGRVALDALDDLKLGLLAGTLDRAALERLKAAAGGLKGASGDEKLDQVLAEIDLRVEVELAKMNASAVV